MTGESDPSPEQPAGDIQRQWMENARQSGEADVYAGKRQQERVSWFPQLEVRVPAAGDQTRVYLASGHDISDGGVRFFCRQPIELFANVEMKVEGEEASVRVTVRHCTRTFNGYLIGADFVK